jgi:hypothetical protein
MGNWRDSLPSNWFSHKDLDKGPMLVTVKRFSVETIGDDKKPCVWFNEHDKGLGLNITNGNTIEQIAGTPDPDKWTGLPLVLYRTETDYKGARVECVRIRAPKPGAKLPEPPAEFTASDDDVPF